MSNDQEAAAQHAMYVGAAQGGAFGFAFGGGAHLLLSHYNHFYRTAARPSMKLAVVAMSTIVGGVVRAENHMLQSRQEYLDREYTTDRRVLAARDATKQSSTTQWLTENKYGIVGSVWLAAMATSLFVSFRQKHVSFDKKVINARLMAQFLTLGALVVTATIAPMKRSEIVEEERDW